MTSTSKTEINIRIKYRILLYKFSDPLNLNTLLLFGILVVIA